MKLLGLNISVIDYEYLYRNRTEQYRKEMRKTKIFSTAANTLNKENDKLCKENGRLKALVDSLREDELAIRCQSLEDANKALSEKIAKYDEVAGKKRAQKAEQARRYRNAKKRERENQNIVDLDVLIYDGRQLGYDIEMRTTNDGKSSFHLVSRDSGKDVYSANTLDTIKFIIEKRKKEIYGED